MEYFYIPIYKMDNIILIKYNREDLENLVEDAFYLVLFERLRASIIFPGPKYVKRNIGTVEYYSNVLTSFDKQEISMKYRGVSAREEHLFEVDPVQIIRSKKLDEILGKD
jgi:hypothetical protein